MIRGTHALSEADVGVTIHKNYDPHHRNKYHNVLISLWPGQNFTLEIHLLCAGFMNLQAHMIWT